MVLSALVYVGQGLKTGQGTGRVTVPLPQPCTCLVAEHFAVGSPLVAL